MPELKEVFEMVTKQTEPELDSWGDQERRQRRAARNRRIGAFAVTAGVGVAVVALMLAGRDESNPTPPEPGTQPRSTAEAVADGFVGSLSTFDADGATSYLADDADVSGLVTSMGDEGLRGTPDEVPLFLSMLEAMDLRQLRPSCGESGDVASGTAVRCAFEFHQLGSDDLYLAPFEGSHVDVTVRGGEVVDASMYWETERFSSRIWEPFARWVSRTYPQDAALMYEDETYGAVHLSPRSIRLWERRVQEFVTVFATNPQPGFVGRVSRVVDGVPFSLHVPRGDWFRFGTVSLNKSIVGPQGAEAIIFWTTFPDGATAEPCSRVLPSSIGGTAADLAAAVSTAPGTDLVAGPSDVTLGGRPAKLVTLTVREDAGCDPGYFFSWPAVYGGPLWPETPIGTDVSVWIVDVDGTLLFIEAETSEDATDGLYREVMQIVGSIRFD